MFERGDSVDGDEQQVGGGSSTTTSTPAWHEIDAALRSVAKRRATLDAEEARWLVAARRDELHRHFGFATLLEYMERVLGYTPHAAMERLRVAEALTELPVISGALADGRLTFSAVRELTRIATPETEVIWVGAARDRTVRDIESMVAGRRPGDLPDTPRTPAETRGLLPLRFDVSAETMALFEDARRMIEDEVGERLDTDVILATMCRAVLDGAGERGAEGRARHQIAMTVCEECERGWQHGDGTPIEVPSAVVERAQCDAERIGALDAVVPVRATQDVPLAVRRLVWLRDHGQCRVPGCRSKRFLDLHHVKHRAAGGDHTADNVCLLCSAHHAAHHDGRLLIEGTVATDLVFRHADGRPYGAPPPSTISEDARAALCRMGYRSSEARAAVELARSEGADRDAVALLRRALQELRPSGMTIEPSTSHVGLGGVPVRA